MSDKTGNKEGARLEEVYKHGMWDITARRYEVSFAKKLYERSDVREVGQEALSRISTLLVRYNRLKELEKGQESIKQEADAKENHKYDKKVHKVDDQIQAAKDELAGLNVDLPADATDEQKKERADKKVEVEKKLKHLQEKKDSLLEEHLKNLDKIKTNVEKAIDEGLATTLDRDETGGIRTATMLGGEGIGARGYTLEEGSDADKRKGANYIDEIMNGQGTFMDQMSLIDNAVNSGGMEMDMSPGQRKELEPGNEKEGTLPSYKTSSAKNLNQVFREITSEDLQRMNGSWAPDEKKEGEEDDEERYHWQKDSASEGNRLEINMDEINKQRDAKGFDDLIGETKQQKSIQEVAKLRGQTKESLLRKKGKAGVLATHKANKEGKKLLTPHGFTKRSFFGKAFERKWMNPKKVARNNTLRRMRIREGAAAFREQLNLRQQRITKAQVKDNAKDKADAAIGKLNLKQEEQSVAEDMKKTGFLTAVASQAKTKDGVNDGQQMEEEIKKAPKEKSVRNMLGAFKLLFKDKGEEGLKKFRLALMAYFVPSGKYSMYELMKESHEVMGENKDNLSEAAAMYRNIDPMSTEEINQLKGKMLYPDETIINIMKWENSKKKDWVAPEYKGPITKKEKKEEEPPKQEEEPKKKETKKDEDPLKKEEEELKKEEREKEDPLKKKKDEEEDPLKKKKDEDEDPLKKKKDEEEDPLKKKKDEEEDPLKKKKEEEEKKPPVKKEEEEKPPEKKDDEIPKHDEEIRVEDPKKDEEPPLIDTEKKEEEIHDEPPIKQEILTDGEGPDGGMTGVNMHQTDSIIIPTQSTGTVKRRAGKRKTVDGTGEKDVPPITRRLGGRTTVRYNHVKSMAKVIEIKNAAQRELLEKMKKNPKQKFDVIRVGQVFGFNDDEIDVLKEELEHEEE